MKITPLVKLCVVAGAAWGLYLLWHKGLPHCPDEGEGAVETEVAVQVGKISLRTLRHYVSAYGTVEPEPAAAGTPAASAHITAPLAALVAEVNCFEGQSVEKGQTLFTLDQSALDQALARRAQLHITAPLSGTVVYLNLRPGEVTDPERPTPLVVVADLTRLIVAANVPSSQLPFVKLDQKVEIIPQQGDDPNAASKTEAGDLHPTPAVFIGKVKFIEKQVDPKTDMGLLDVSVPPEAQLRPGQFVSVRIITEERRDCLAVPAQSVVKNESGEWVISLVSGKWAVQQPVMVGFRDGDLVQVHNLMLQAGDQVVTVGAYGLPEKTRIRRLNE